MERISAEYMRAIGDANMLGDVEGVFRRFHPWIDYIRWKVLSPHERAGVIASALRLLDEGSCRSVSCVTCPLRMRLSSIATRCPSLELSYATSDLTIEGVSYHLRLLLLTNMCLSDVDVMRAIIDRGQQRLVTDHEISRLMGEEVERALVSYFMRQTATVSDLDAVKVNLYRASMEGFPNRPMLHAMCRGFSEKRSWCKALLSANAESGANHKPDVSGTNTSDVTCIDYMSLMETSHLTDDQVRELEKSYEKLRSAVSKSGLQIHPWRGYMSVSEQ